MNETIFNFISENWIEIIGAVVGLLYLYFEYKASILMWPTGIVMSSFYTIVFIKATFYAFACINVYYIVVGIYGWIEWHRSRNQNEDSSFKIKRTPTRLYFPILLITIALFALITFLLRNFTDSNVIWGDSFVTTLSIVAMVMLAKKYAEQWILLIIVNVVSIFLYFHQNLYPTATMYLFYSIVSVLGYIKWRKLATDEANE